ncbi:MAG: hypothetical protein IJ503_03620 [Akkermansia sp.]|nr:hypothetical protein [Akkermansia sp.]
MRFLLPALSLLLSSCSFYQLNTHSLLNSVGREEVRADNWAATSYSVSEHNDILYIKVPVYYVSPPSALLTATCPFVAGGSDWKTWWSFPEYRAKRTSTEMTYMYFPLDKEAVQVINRQNRDKLVYRNYQAKAYNIGEFESFPHRTISTNVKVSSVATVINISDAADKIGTSHYIAKPIAYVAWGIDTISLIPCSIIGWVVYDIPGMLIK